MDEYRFLQIVPMTHEEYLDADPVWVRWMLEIDKVASKDRSAAPRNQ